MKNTLLIHNRYHLLDKLGEGGMGTVWRAFDKLTGQHIALKQVRFVFNSVETPDAPEALALAREFQTLSTLRHPNIISVLEYGFDAGQPYLTMALLDGAQALSPETCRHLKRPPHDLLLDILAALTYLHRRGVIHCDLKPSNVLIDSAGVVRLIDFGIAVMGESAGEKSSGTLNYLAPEVLAGAPVSVAADLYAVGVMAYEFYAGHHPFDTGDVSGLLARVLYDEPDFSPMPPAIRPWIARLLSKTADERYASAGMATRALCNALDIPIPPESADIRESFLQAAQFVGRESELRQLTDALPHMLNGTGAAIIVRGESGVGKSRLVEELRVQALVRGARVVRGQAVEGGGHPYQMWRDILPSLVLDAQLSPRDAAALSIITSDIHRLTGHPAPKRPPKDAHQRLPRLLANLIRAQTHPLVLICEDIQWAEDSLPLLGAVIPLAANRQLFFIATQRSDERSTLPRELELCDLITLERFSPTALADLSGAILGDIGRSEALVSQLQRETEGNVFFVVELLRALAEDVGSLNEITPDALVTTQMTGGLRALMRRRLNRLPAWAHPLLHIAAVAGRRLDLRLLGHVTGLDDMPPLADWLTVCADCAIVEVADGAWRFCHDKIRESLLADFDAPKTKNLHAQVAQAMEAAYPSDTTYAPVLSLHWAGAGDWGRAMHHLRLAVNGWRAVSAYQDAQGFLTQLLAWLPDGDSAERAELLAFFGEMYIEVGILPEAYQAFGASVGICRRLGLSELLPTALTGLCYFEYRSGNVTLAVSMLDEVLSLPIIDPLTHIRALNLRVVVYETPPTPDEMKAYLDKAMALSLEHDSLEGRLLTYQNSVPYYFLIEDIEGALNVLNQMADLAEQSGNNAMASAAYVNLAEIYLEQGDIAASEKVIKALEESLALTGDLFLGSWYWKLQAQLSHLHGDIKAAIAHFKRAIDGFIIMGATGEVAFTRTWMLLYLIEAGRVGDAAAQLSDLLAETQQLNGNEEQVTLTIASYAVVAMMMGDTAHAADWAICLTNGGQSIRGMMILEFVRLLQAGLDPEDMQDAQARARYPDIAAAFESLAQSGW